MGQGGAADPPLVVPTPRSGVMRRDAQGAGVSLGLRERWRLGGRTGGDRTNFRAVNLQNAKCMNDFSLDHPLDRLIALPTFLFQAPASVSP